MLTYIRVLTLVAAVFTLLNAGCTRKTDGPTTVKFRLPPKSAFKKSGDVNAQTVSQISDFDCLGVMVTGPEAALSQNTCYKEDESTEFYKAGKPYGPFVFLNASSQDISIEVPRGDSRVVRVIGFTSKSGTCIDLDNDIDEPFVLATSSPLTLNGPAQAIELQLRFDAANEIGDCKGPDFSENDGPSGGPYLRVEGLYPYESNENPAAKPLTRGVCYPVSFFTYEPCNGGVCTFYVPQSDVVITFANSSVKFYGTSSSCTNNSVVLPSLTMTGGNLLGTHAAPAYTAYMRVPLQDTGTNGTDLENEISLNVGAEVEFTQPQRSYFNIGKPVVNFTGLAPAANTSLTQPQLGGQACSGTTTTFTLYHAGKVAPNFVAGNEIALHENFSFNQIGLDLLNACAGSPVTISKTGASATGYLSQKPFAQLGANNTINTAIELGISPNAGKVIIGGAFTNVSSVTVSSLARLFPDGRLDISFKPPILDGAVNAVLELPDGSLLVGGNFAVAGGVAHAGLVHLFMDGTVDTGFTIEVGGGESVLALARSGTTVFVGGQFTQLSPQSRANIGAIDMSAMPPSVTAWNPGADASVLAILPAADMNGLFVGGSFNTIGGQSRNYLASFNLPALTISAWNPNADTDVTSLNKGIAQEILVGGNFTNIGGGSRLKAAVFAGSTPSPTLGLNLYGQSINGNIRVMKHIGAFYYAGGDIDGAGVGGLVRFSDSAGSFDGTYYPGINGEVMALIPSGSELLAFGGFTQLPAGPVDVNGYVAVDSAGARFPEKMNPNKSWLTFKPDLYHVINPVSTFGH